MSRRYKRKKNIQIKDIKIMKQIHLNGQFIFKTVCKDSINSPKCDLIQKIQADNLTYHTKMCFGGCSKVFLESNNEQNIDIPEYTKQLRNVCGKCFIRNNAKTK